MVDFCKPRSIYTMLRGPKSNISCICYSQENEGEHRKYEDFSENWDSNYPPIAPLSWRRSFCQLRKQWSDFARNIDDERKSTSENADEENASLWPDNEEFPDSANPTTVQYMTINDNPTLCCKYQESLADRSDDLQGMAEEVLEETSPQVESLLRRSCMSNGEKRVVVDNFLIKFLLDPAKKDCFARSMIRRSTTTLEELRNTLIYSIKRNYAKLEGKKNSVRALVQALIRNERVQRKTLRFIFSKEPAHASFAESDSFQKVQDEVWALAKGGDVNNDKTRAKIESKLRTSTLSEDEKELIIDRVLTENVLDANVRNIFGQSMRIRSTMSTDERNHNIIKLLECINLPSDQKSDITTIVLEDCPFGYHFESDLSQYNVESAINALTFHIASAHNSREHQGRNDFHSKQTKLASRMESQDCVESHSKSKLTQLTTQSAGISRGTNYCERLNPNNTHEIEIEQNPIGNPICYPVYECKNTRHAIKTSKYSDLKSNLFPENYIYDCSNKRTVSRKYKKSKYCYNPTCDVQLRKHSTNPEKIFKEFFQEIPHDSITSDGRCTPADACSSKSEYNEKKCIHSGLCEKLKSETHIEHEIFEGQQLQNVGSGAHLHLKQKKSQPSQLPMYPCNGNSCRKMESRPYIEHEIFDGRQLQNVCSGAHSQSKHKTSRASLITMCPDNSNSCRKVESRPHIEHEIFDAQKLENVCSGVNLQLGQVKCVPSNLILSTSSCNPRRKLERESCVKNASFGGEQLENVGCGSHLQYEQKKTVPSQIAVSTSSCNPCRKLERESCVKTHSFGGEQLENVGRGSHLQFEQKKSVPSQITMDSCSCNPCSCNPYSCNPCRKLKSKSYVKQDIFDGEQVENVGRGSHLQLEQKESVPRQLIMDLGECNSLQSSIKPYKGIKQYSHEFFSCDSNCRRSHEDCTLCVFVSKVKYLTEKCRQLFSMKTLCRLLECISFFGRFMWLPILSALIWFFSYKKDDSVRCFMYCRKC